MTNGRITDPARFFEAATLAERDVTLPGGLVVRVRELSVGLRSEFSQRSREEPGSVAAWLLSVSCLRDNGMLLFSPDDVERLTHSSPRIVQYLGLEVMRLSGLIADEGADGGND